MWKLVEAVISTKTAARVVFLGNDKKLWREEIKVLQLDQFPNGMEEMETMIRK
jgi:hypothetical protein